MKKILSLFIATALFASAFASVAFAKDITKTNKATLTLSCEPIDWSDPSILSGADAFTEGDYDSYICYRFTLTAGNLPQLSYASKKYTGEGLVQVGASFTIDTEAEKEVDWFYYIPAGKGSITYGNGGYAFDYKPSNDLTALITTLSNADNTIASGSSRAVATFDLVIAKDYSYELELLDGSLAFATYSGVGASGGTSSYPVKVEENEQGTEGGNLTLNAASFTLPLSATPVTTYTIAFKDYDGSNLQSNEYNENDTVTAPTATRSGYTFSHWSETQGGAAATVLTTATADKTYYAVYTKDPVITDSSIDVKKPISGTIGLKDLQGQDVTLTKNYGIAKFSKAIDTTANNYFLAVEAENGDKDDLAIDFDLKGVEIRGASTTFFAIVRSSTRVIKSIQLKEVAK